MEAAAPRSRIHLCGQLRFTLDGEDRAGALRGRQGRMAFAFLVLNRQRPVRRDELVEALWADEGAPPSEAALAPVLSRLRRALAPGTVEGREGVTLVLPGPAWVDAEVAAAALAAARAAHAEGHHQEAVAAAREAAELTAAGLLPGLGDAPWLTDARTGIEELRVEALEVAASAGLAAGALPQAEADARAAVALAPFRESARAALIRALAARGNVAEAVRAYEELRTLLRDELGTAPGPELMALHGELIAAEAPAAPPATTVPARAGRGPSATPDLVERERELDRISAAAAALAAGRGGLVLFEGPAGLGKTRLLAELRDRAAAAGAGVLDARATTLEREYGFGVVRQLFEAVGADHPALADAPGARAVLGHALAAGAPAPAAGEGLFAAFHGLHHVVGQLARDRPLLLTIDDLQWSDAESLRFTAYLARRLSRLPVLLAATVRTGEPDADEELLAELAADPDATVVEPQPLTAAASAQLVRARLGQDAADAFTAACHGVTAGNPLLLRQLLNALESEGVTPDAEHAPAVEAIGPRAVARTVLLRLARLPQDTVAVARAVAVLGQNPALPAIAALAAIPEARAADAIAVLDRAEILRGDGGTLGFVHPLVRDAVYHELPAARREQEHARAARVLADVGAAPEAVAAQLLRAPKRGDAWTVERLRQASEVALDRGAPVPARVYLERALEEPPELPQRGPLAIELGRVASYVHGPAAVSALRRALADLSDPVDRARAIHMLGRMLMFTDGAPEAAALCKATRDALPESEQDLRDGLQAVYLVCAFFGAVDPSELAVLEPVARGPRGLGPGSRELTAMAALTTAVITGPSALAADLGREALADDIMLHGEPGLFSPGAAIAISFVDPAEAARVWEHIAAFSTRRGSLLDALANLLWGGFNLMWKGDLVAASESQWRSHEGETLFGSAPSADMGYTPGILAMIGVARGHLDEAERGLLLTGQHSGTSDGTRFWFVGKAELALARGRYEEAIAIADTLAPGRPPGTNPIWAPWRSLRARGLAGMGHRDEAVALAAEELELARSYGAAWGIGRALRQLGELTEGEAGVAHLREAVALLDGTSAGLERVRAWTALALATGEDAARATALELARETGAEGLEAALRAAQA